MRHKSYSDIPHLVQLRPGLLFHMDMMTLPLLNDIVIFLTLLRKKSDVLVHALQRWYHDICVPTGYSSFVLRMDNAGEYTSQDAEVWCHSVAIRTEMTPAYRQGFNGVAECHIIPRKCMV
jgi:hypothetical protein